MLITTGVLHKCFPNCQIVRWGGDEFIVVISQEESRYAEDENIAYFQSTLREWTRQKCPIELTSSIGIATKDASLTVDEAVKHADAALYEAKRTGKSQHLRYEEMQPSC